MIFPSFGCALCEYSLYNSVIKPYSVAVPIKEVLPAAVSEDTAKIQLYKGINLKRACRLLSDSEDLSKNSKPSKSGKKISSAIANPKMKKSSTETVSRKTSSILQERLRYSDGR